MNAEDIVNNLLDRRGFDEWWHELEDEIKEEIKQEMAKNIAKFKRVK